MEGPSRTEPEASAVARPVAVPAVGATTAVPPAGRSGPPPLTAEHVLALQRTAGNQAVCRYLARVADLSPGPLTLDPGLLGWGLGELQLDLSPSGLLAEPGTPRPKHQFTLFPADTSVPDAVAILENALAPVAGTPEVQGMWASVVAQVRTPAGARPKSAPKSMPPALYAPATVAALKKLTPTKADAKPEEPGAVALRRKSSVLKEVFEFLLAAREASLHEGEEVPEDDAKSEWETTLVPIHDRFSTNSLEHYKSVRGALIAKFGGLADGAQPALERAVEFYGKETQSASFLGLGPERFHRNLVSALKYAESLLPLPRPALKSISGLGIRPNANNKLALSEHSFGFAIDVNGATSPNLTFPTELVNEISGTDVTTAADGRTSLHDRMKEAGSASGVEQFETIKAEAERVFAASDKFKAAFEDEVSICTAMLEVAKHRGAPAVGVEELRGLVAAAAAEGKAGKAHDALARAVFPETGPGVTQSWDPRHVKRIVDVLKLMWTTFEATFKHDDKGRRKRGRGGDQRVDAKADQPTLGQVARHGFMSVPPEVVAALVGSGLRWLGAMDGEIKDFMHFELYPPPPLPTGGGKLARVEAGTPDAGARDAGTPDGGTHDAGAADAGPADGGTPMRVAGDPSSKKIVYIAWTFDDGPSKVTGDMEGAAAGVAATWYVARDHVKTKDDLAKLKAKQDSGQEIAIHGIHPTSSHLAWFPADAGSYPDIKDAIADLKDFHTELTAAGIRVKMVRLPYGLLTELMGALRKRKATGNVEDIARSLIKGSLDAKSASPGAVMVQKELEQLMAAFTELHVLEWGGDAKQDLSAQSWEAGSEPPEAGLANTVEATFAKTLAATASDGKVRSLVILAHDMPVAGEGAAPYKRSSKVAQDILKMEADALKAGVRLEYRTMSQLYPLRTGKTLP